MSMARDALEIAEGNGRVEVDECEVMRVRSVRERFWWAYAHTVRAHVDVAAPHSLALCTLPNPCNSTVSTKTWETALFAVRTELRGVSTEGQGQSS